MQIPVLIETVPGNGYRAKSGEPFGEVGEGATPDEALAQLKQCVQQRIEKGDKLVSLDLAAGDHSWLPFAGMFQEEDPVIQKWLQIMKSQRDEPEDD